MITVQLNYRGLVLAVSAESTADLKWLQDFLGPCYLPLKTMANRVEHRLALRSEPHSAERQQLWAQWKAAGSLTSVLAHVLDSATLHLPCHREADGSLLVWEEKFGCFYHCEQEGITTVLREEISPPPRRPRSALMRAVRELALHHELRCGSLALHAAGLVCNGKAVLFAGPRRAGKTTLLSACLELVPGLALLANDRVILHPQSDGWPCRGMATIVSVRAGDESLLPGLRQRLHRQAIGPEAAIGEPIARAFPADGRLMLSPQQFCQALGVPMAAESQVGAILLPKIDVGASGVQLHRLDPAAAAAPLAEALLGAAHLHSRSEIFDTPASGPFPSPEERRQLVERLAHEVPCHSVILGAQAYRPDTLAALLADALGSR